MKWKSSNRYQPLLLFNAKELDYSAIAAAHRAVKAKPEYHIAGDTTRKEMQDMSRSQVIADRQAKGKHWSCLAKEIGHDNYEEKKFYFQPIEGAGPGVQPDCILCGLNHQFDNCRYFQRAYFEHNSRVYQSLITQAQIEQSQSTQQNCSFEPPAMTPSNIRSISANVLVNYMAVGGNIRGYAELDLTTRKLTIPTHFVSGYFDNDEVGEFPLDGAGFGTLNGVFLDPADLRRRRREGEDAFNENSGGKRAGWLPDDDTKL